MTPEGHYPKNPLTAQSVQTYKDANALQPILANLVVAVLLSWTAAQAVLGTVNKVLAAVTDNGTQRVITTGLGALSCPRNITATAGGTATDVKGITVTIVGTDITGAEITEVLPAFTVNTAGTVAGAKMFASVTSVTIPAHDGTGATTSIGEGNLLAIPYKLPYNTALFAVRGTTREATAPTLATDATNLYGNSVSFSTALDGTAAKLYLLPYVAA